MKKYESRFEQTGNIFEWQYIGEVDINSREYQKELRRFEEEVAYMSKEDVIYQEKARELAKKFQPFDPTHPNKPFARDVRISLLDLMIKNKKWITDSEEDQDRVKFYTTVKSPLDYCGVDAFVEFKDLDSKKYLVTLDLTLNPQKQKHKSDIIVQGLPDPNLDEDKLRYLATIEQYAQKALDLIEIRKSYEEENKEKKPPQS